MASGLGFLLQADRHKCSDIRLWGRLFCLRQPLTNTELYLEMDGLYGT